MPSESNCGSKQSLKQELLELAIRIGKAVLSKISPQAVPYFRNIQERKRFLKAVPYLRAMSAVKAELLAHHVSSDLSPARLAIEIGKILLPHAENTFRAYCGSEVMCSLKVPDETEDYLLCIYGPGNNYPEMARQVKELSLAGSNAGIAFRDDRQIFIPSLRNPGKNGYSLPEALLRECERYDIHGAVVTPVRAWIGDTDKPQPVAVFKIDLIGKTTLYENEITKLLIDLVVAHFASGIQNMITLQNRLSQATTKSPAKSKRGKESRESRRLSG